MRVGLFGGTFNPPHAGHRLIAEQAVEALGLDRLLWMPAARSPLKDGSHDVAAHHRLAMTSLAAANHSAFRVSDAEIRRPSPSYTVDTVRQLAAQYPEAVLHLLIGSDSWASFGAWRDPEEILGLVDVVVYPRGGGHEAQAFGSVTPILLDAPRIDISSSLVRDRLRRGAPVSGLIDSDVGDYIRKHRLYPRGS